MSPIANIIGSFSMHIIAKFHKKLQKYIPEVGNTRSTQKSKDNIVKYNVRNIVSDLTGVPNTSSNTNNKLICISCIN